MDNYNLERFIKAQSTDYNQALSEIKAGHKTSHWIWYIFPQITGLGHSNMSEYYGITSLEEAKDYLQEPTLKANLLEISEALLQLPSRNPTEVMGYIDDKKLKSCMTLFSIADPECKVFQQVLDKYFGGKQDKRTLQILGIETKK
jgi:uncharacterized protein (DUF1810 family)